MKMVHMMAFACLLTVACALLCSRIHAADVKNSSPAKAETTSPHASSRSDSVSAKDSASAAPISPSTSSVTKSSLTSKESSVGEASSTNMSFSVNKAVEGTASENVIASATTSSSFQGSTGTSQSVRGYYSGMTQDQIEAFREEVLNDPDFQFLKDVKHPEKSEPPLHKFTYRQRLEICDVHAPIRTFWEVLRHTKIIGILEVPAVGQYTDKRDEPYKHSAGFPNARYGQKDTTLAFSLSDFLHRRVDALKKYVFIPPEFCREFLCRKETNYLVPLWVHLETAKTSEGQYTLFEYDLFPAKIEYPQIELKDKEAFKTVIAAWRELIAAEETPENIAAQIAFHKEALQNPEIAPLHFDSVKDLALRGIFKAPFEQTDEFRFWCGRFLDKKVSTRARTEIERYLAGMMRTLAISVATEMLEDMRKREEEKTASAEHIEGDTDEEKAALEAANWVSAPNGDLEKLLVLKEAFFKALDDVDIDYDASDVLSKVFRLECYDALLSRLEKKETRVRAIMMGKPFVDDIAFAKRATELYAECRKLYSAPKIDIELVRDMKSKDQLVTFYQAYQYFFTQGNEVGEKMLHDIFLNKCYTDTDRGMLLNLAIMSKDARFESEVYEMAKCIRESDQAVRSGPLCFALAYLCQFNHEGGIELAKLSLKEKEMDAYQKRKFPEAFNLAAGKPWAERMQTLKDCYVWVKERELLIKKNAPSLPESQPGVEPEEAEPKMQAKIKETSKVDAIVLTR